MLQIDFRYHDNDIGSVLRTHDVFEQWLSATGLGRITYRCPREERAAAVWQVLVHGTHQIGLTRMSASPRDGVVDPELAVWGAPNLHLATTAVLPTSGQANPTLTAVALAHRLAAKLVRASVTPFPGRAA
jgi:choline dehydrogenase-like flavoprotein